MLYFNGVFCTNENKNTGCVMRSVISKQICLHVAINMSKSKNSWLKNVKYSCQ